MTKNEHTSLDLATSALLEPNGVDEDALERVFALVRAHRADDADLYFQLSRAESWMVEEGEVKSGSFAIDQGVGVRVVSGEKTAFAYADDISGSCEPARPSPSRRQAIVEESHGNAAVGSPQERDRGALQEVESERVLHFWLGPSRRFRSDERC